MAESKACCTIPPVVAGNYEPKGTYNKIAGLDVYVTGSQNATIGVVDVYDIFGLQPQTIQGADRLAAELGAIVLMPDFFKGEPINMAWYPPDTEEKQGKVQKFISERAFAPEHQTNISLVAEEAKKMWPQVTGWGLLGLCWGGKMAALASGPGTPFKVSGQVHPAKMAKEDAENISIPHICLASRDEPADMVEAYSTIFRDGGKTGVVETYSDMPHGWMGARADLNNGANLKEYVRGYQQVAEFFRRYV